MDKIEWKISVPIFRNTLILKQLFLAIGLPIGVIVVVIALTSEKSVYAYYCLFLIALLLFLTWLFVMLVYRGKYDVEYSMDKSKVCCRTQAKQSKTNRVVNGLTVTLGLLSGKPSAMGAGMLTHSRQNEYLKWSKIKRVKYKPANSVILLRGGFAENMALFCTSENYKQVEKFVIDNITTQKNKPL